MPCVPTDTVRVVFSSAQTPRTSYQPISNFSEQQFKQKMNVALESIRRVLDTTRCLPSVSVLTVRNPILPEDVPHKYQDKYQLAEFLTNTALAGQMNCLDSLGLGATGLKTLKEWSKERAITLRFESIEV
jgi:hypothetical protein